MPWAHKLHTKCLMPVGNNKQKRCFSLQKMLFCLISYSPNQRQQQLNNKSYGGSEKPCTLPSMKLNNWRRKIKLWRNWLASWRKRRTEVSQLKEELKKKTTSSEGSQKRKQAWTKADVENLDLLSQKKELTQSNQQWCSGCKLQWRWEMERPTCSETCGSKRRRNGSRGWGDQTPHH